MLERLRISFAGALFHITCRGNNRERIFLDDADFERFKRLLQRYRSKHEFKLYAYAMMSNHYHLLVETTSVASISTIMHAINTAYAMYFNSRHDHTGHVFEGRFHSRIIDSENYFLEVMRYVDLNPVRAQIVPRPQEYPWSSHRHFASGERESFLDDHELYMNLGDSREERQAEYRAYVEQRLEEGVGQIDPILKKSRFVGGDDFECRMIRVYGETIWPKYRRLLNRIYEIRNATRPE